MVLDLFMNNHVHSALQTTEREREQRKEKKASHAEKNVLHPQQWFRNSLIIMLDFSKPLRQINTLCIEHMHVNSVNRTRPSKATTPIHVLVSTSLFLTLPPSLRPVQRKLPDHHKMNFSLAKYVSGGKGEQKNSKGK